jgi:HPt (histidine-containing phosphotransfer) domain-containing protein
MPEPIAPIVVEVERDLEELIPLFLEQRRKDRVTIARALDSGDFETLRLVGHGMAGAGTSYGFPEITAFGGVLERAALAHDGVEIARQATLFADYMDRVVVKYV